MQNAGVDAQAGIKIAGRNINNLGYEDDTTLVTESKEELKSPLMNLKEESEKYTTLMAESEEELSEEPLDESERGEWKNWLKAQHSEN